MRLSKTVGLGILMAVVAMSLAPASRAGIIGAAVVVLGGCGMYAVVLVPARWKELLLDDHRGVFVSLIAVIGLVWLAGISRSLSAMWPGTTAMGLGWIVVSGAIAIGAGLVAWLEHERPPWLITAATVLGLALGIGAVHLDVFHGSADTVVADGMVSGQMLAIWILIYREASSRKEALQYIGLALGVLAGLVALHAGTLWLIRGLSWQLALGLVCSSLLLLLWLLEKPTASLLGLVLIVAGGRLLGGHELEILGGGAWGIGLTLLEVAAKCSVTVHAATAVRRPVRSWSGRSDGIGVP